jgi:hypothetical protein
MFIEWCDPRISGASDEVGAGAATDDDGLAERADEGPGWSAATIGFVLAHIPLAWLMHYVSSVAALHALFAVGSGLWLAASDDRPERAAYAVAYVTACEVLWRMTNDQLFWELAKYSVILIALVALVRAGGVQTLMRPALVFGLLMPSALLTVARLPLSEVRNQLSFNLSGPMALIVCSAYFGSLTLSARSFQRLCLTALGPVAGIAFITLFMIVTNPDITFSHQSNFALSGGFGPNQVSAALGFGVLMALLFALERDAPTPVRALALGLLMWFAAQSALTFSRGGLFCAVSAAIVATIFFVKEPRSLVMPLATALVVFGLGYYVVWPRLDEFTGGNLSLRFHDADTSLRADLTAEDIELFREHPVMGVGPGMSKQEHLDDIISHTEFTRLLAEHGLFGVLTIALFVGAAVRNVFRGKSSREKAIAAALVTWAFLFMSNSAMRLVAPSFTFGLIFCTLTGTRREVVATSVERTRDPVVAFT